MVAFYTLSSAQIGFEELPTSIAKGLPRYQISAIRIARLAVSKKWQRKGYGALALKYAFRRILSISPHAGTAFILVDVKDSARGFYERFGFVEIDSEKRTYAIPLGTVLKALIQ
ncbi:MAG: GNAT family N-acetyltransferase [Bacilli bacterium]|nr:GNAT family N-acetyltransferase [Bacilli bacterium]